MENTGTINTALSSKDFKHINAKYINMSENSFRKLSLSNCTKKVRN